MPENSISSTDENTDLYIQQLESLLLEVADLLQNRRTGKYPQNAIESGHVKELCRKYGYGSVMDCAAAQWISFLEENGCPPEGAFVVGPCIGTVESLLRRIRETIR